jgi:cysteinyl-tRNA synthetase
LAGLARIADAAGSATTPHEREAAKSVLLGSAALLGLLQQAPRDWFQRDVDGIDPAWVQERLDRRQAARAARDFATADAIRAELAARGIAIEDGPDGARWKVANRDECAA